MKQSRAIEFVSVKIVDERPVVWDVQKRGLMVGTVQWDFPRREYCFFSCVNVSLSWYELRAIEVFIQKQLIRKQYEKE